MSTHQDGPFCTGCAQKLTQAHVDLVNWYTKHILPNFPRVHISWSFRGKEDQELAFSEGKTHAHWPKSPHNHMEKGKPYSLALDLFQIINGMGVWSKEFFKSINDYNQKNGLEITWGGTFKSLGDFDHFQIIEVDGLKSVPGQNLDPPDCA